MEGEKGCDAALILPESQQTLEYGVKLLKNHSTCVIVSFPKNAFSSNLEIWCSAA
jgi:propanol-preferring alcohol dehydrogenase